MAYEKLNLKTGDQFKAESLGHIETALAEVISSDEGKASSERVATLEAMNGVSPESPVDGQTANLIGQDDTLTRAAINQLFQEDPPGSGLFRTPLLGA